jgi:hypothetical protein
MAADLEPLRGAIASAKADIVRAEFRGDSKAVAKLQAEIAQFEQAIDAKLVADEEQRLASITGASAAEQAALDAMKAELLAALQARVDGARKRDALYLEINDLDDGPDLQTVRDLAWKLARASRHDPASQEAVAMSIVGVLNANPMHCTGYSAAADIDVLERAQKVCRRLRVGPRSVPLQPGSELKAFPMIKAPVLVDGQHEIPGSRQEQLN